MNMQTITLAIQGLLGFVFLLAGGMKLAQSREKVMVSGGKWAEDFSPRAIKLIGLGEVACALGITVRTFIGHGHWTAPFSAVGIAIFMAGAFATHLRRREAPFLALTAVFFALAAFVAYMRWPFG